MTSGLVSADDGLRARAFLVFPRRGSASTRFRQVHAGGLHAPLPGLGPGERGEVMRLLYRRPVLSGPAERHSPPFSPRLPAHFAGLDWWDLAEVRLRLARLSNGAGQLFSPALRAFLAQQNSRPAPLFAALRPCGCRARAPGLFDPIKAAMGAAEIT